MVSAFAEFFLPPLRGVAKHEEHWQQGNWRQKHCRILGYCSYNSFPMAEQSGWLVIIHCYKVNPTPFCPQILSQVFYINTHTHTQMHTNAQSRYDNKTHEKILFSKIQVGENDNGLILALFLSIYLVLLMCYLIPSEANWRKMNYKV